MQKILLCPTAALVHTFRHCATDAPHAQATDGYRTAVFHSAADVPLTDWYRVVTPDNLFLRQPYLQALETAQQGRMQPRYALIYEGSEPVIFAYFQILPFGERMAQLAEIGAKRLVRFVQCNTRQKHLLLCGNACISGTFGYAHTPNYSTDRAQSHILELMQAMAKAEKHISAFSLKDIAPLSAMPPKTAAIPAEPCMELPIQPEWTTFSAYLAAMESKYRQRANSALKKSASVQVRELSTAEIEAHQPTILSLLGHLIRPETVNLMDAGANYFTLLKKALEEYFRVYGYFHEGALVAFRSSLYNGSTLEAHFVGYEPTLNHDMKLYQRLLYDTVGEAIGAKKTGIERISFGRTATEIKSTLGATPIAYQSWVRFASPPLNLLASAALRRVKLPEYTLRHPFKDNQPAEASPKNLLNSAVSATK